MAKQLTERCPGCGSFFPAKPGVMWCPACAATVETVEVEFTPDEMKGLRAQAFIRGCDVPQFVREAVRMLTSPDRYSKKSKRVRGS